MAASEQKGKILVIHGPNLNMLGSREPDVYGHTTLQEIDDRLKVMTSELGYSVETFQSNHEGAIVEKIQETAGSCIGLIINPAAYTHTSVAIRDALIMLDFPIIEVHLSNIYRREDFRKRSLTAGAVTGQISGLGAEGYYLAMTAIIDLVG